MSSVLRIAIVLAAAAAATIAANIVLLGVASGDAVGRLNPRPVSVSPSTRATVPTAPAVTTPTTTLPTFRGEKGHGGKGKGERDHADD
jgi:hypothetical protein